MTFPALDGMDFGGGVELEMGKLISRVRKVPVQTPFVEETVEKDLATRVAGIEEDKEEEEVEQEATPFPLAGAALFFNPPKLPVIPKGFRFSFPPFFSPSTLADPFTLLVLSPAEV